MFGQLLLLAETGPSVLTWLLGLAVLVGLLVLCLLCWAIFRRLPTVEPTLSDLTAATTELHEAIEHARRSQLAAEHLQQQARQMFVRLERLHRAQAEFLHRVQAIVTTVDGLPRQLDSTVQALFHRVDKLNENLRQEVTWVTERAANDSRIW